MCLDRERFLGPALSEDIQCVCVCVCVCVCGMWLNLYNRNCRLHEILYRTFSSVFLLIYGKSHNRTGHEGQGDEYMYIYTISLTWELDGFELSRPPTGCFAPKKDSRCPFTGREVVRSSGLFLMLH